MIGGYQRQNLTDSDLDTYGVVAGSILAAARGSTRKLLDVEVQCKFVRVRS